MFSGLYFWVCWCQSLCNTENASKTLQKTWFVNIRHVQATEQTVRYCSKVWVSLGQIILFSKDALNWSKGKRQTFIILKISISNKCCSFYFYFLISKNPDKTLKKHLLTTNFWMVAYVCLLQLCSHSHQIKYAVYPDNAPFSDFVS